MNEARLSKAIKHRGMTLTRREHAAWHRRHPGNPPRITPGEHQAFLRARGISAEADRRWHKRHKVPKPAARFVRAAAKPVNPFAVGGGFLKYCVAQGWLTCEGTGRLTRYLATRRGKAGLRKFGIEV